MFRNTHWISFGVTVCLFFSLPLRADEKSPIDKLQSETRTESIHSTRLFLTQIDHLEHDVKQRLMRARFTNTTQHFDVDESSKTKIEGFAFTSSLTTGKDTWLLKIEIRNARDIKSARYDYEFKKDNFEFIVNITPNSDMLEWMRARNEFTEYSKQKIEDTKLILNVFGMINSFTLKKEDDVEMAPCPYENYMEREKCQLPSYHPIKIRKSTTTLTMNLNPYFSEAFTCGDLRWWGFRGSLSDHTKRLKAKTAEWIKFYMGKGEEPKFYH